MQIDRASLEKLLAMNDFQLKMVITKLIRESGIDPADFNINPSDLASVRQALGSVSDEELARIVTQFEQTRKQRES